MSLSAQPAISPIPESTAHQFAMHQPFVHDLAGVFHAPVQAWSNAAGVIGGTGAEGVYIGDTRVVSDLRCVAVGAELSPLGTEVRSAREVVFRDVVSLPDGVVDPLVTLERVRTADATGLKEELTLRSDDDRPRTVTLRLGLLTDAASMSAVKEPHRLAAAPPTRPSAHAEQLVARWEVGAEGGSAHLDISGGGSNLAVDGSAVTWDVLLTVPAGGDASASWRLNLTDPSVPFAPAEVPWGPAASTTDRSDGDPQSRATSLLLHRSLSDLDALRLQMPGDASCSFFAAGAPWFFTLFGRDSLIAATLALPVNLPVAEGTLRTLARFQGSVVDVNTGEQPGKILHEVRAQGMALGESHLPPIYYGTIDATPLWIELLHEACSLGMDASVLVELRPALEAASMWLLEHADMDGDGLVEYFEESGSGLANQGWKDSGDSNRFSDGSLAEGAIALTEVQGYAYAAALHAAELIERLDGANSDTTAGASALPARLRNWAEKLRERFHELYWCEDELGPFVALALDGSKRAVDGVGSNMGHLLGTGLLNAEQERIVVDRLLHPSMFSGYGVRTLSTTNGGFGPLRYHGGSVWTHDTGYILRGMLRAGFVEEARMVAQGLLRAADGFGQRLPELFSGQGVNEVSPPLPYPASCRPQAWAAASAVQVAIALGTV